MDTLKGLSPKARAAAEALQAAHPEVRFTSGRRTVAQQARAMADNLATDRAWVRRTYVSTPQRAQILAWLDANPAATRAQTEAGLAEIMEAWSDSERARISKHFSGDAFDVQPVAGARGEAIKVTIRKLPGLVKFLDREGGRIIWHAQFA